MWRAVGLCDEIKKEILETNRAVEAIFLLLQQLNLNHANRTVAFWSIWKHKVRQDVNELSSRVVERTHWSMEDSLVANTTTNICRRVHSNP
jgi:hypothetical protein